MEASEKIKNAIIENQIDITGWCISPNSTMITMIKSCMEEYAEQFKPKWIPVSERLPENGQRVLVYSEENSMVCAIFNPYQKRKCFYCYDLFSQDLVPVETPTHWMPTPENP